MNIAEILKYCPTGTKLYSTVFGEVEFSKVNPDDLIVVLIKDDCKRVFRKDGSYSEYGECVLFPSKDQRDWEKFRLPVKKGDIMMSNNRAFIISDEYADVFHGTFHKYICGINSMGKFSVSHLDGYWTSTFYIPASEEAKKELFDKMAEAGYKWNTDTLELEKMGFIFKEGDVIKDNKNNLYLIVDTNSHPKIGCVLNQNMKLTILNRVTTLALIKFTLANKEEKNKLFSALVKEGYKYDKEQHKFVKQEFKPFDKVLVRDNSDEKWAISMFSYYDQEDDIFPYVCIGNRYCQCIPYNGQTEHLIGTKTI